VNSLLQRGCRVLDDDSEQSDMPNFQEANLTIPSPAKIAFLKLYDWRFAPQLRHDSRLPTCSRELFAIYVKFV